MFGVKAAKRAVSLYITHTGVGVGGGKHLSHIPRRFIAAHVSRVTARGGTTWH